MARRRVDRGTGLGVGAPRIGIGTSSDRSLLGRLRYRARNIGGGTVPGVLEVGGRSALRSEPALLTPSVMRIVFAHVRFALLAVVMLTLDEGSARGEWLTYPEGLAQADSTGKLVFVEVYTDWCAYCTKLERRVLKRDDVRRVLDKHFAMVKLDAEDDTPIVRVGDGVLDSRKLARKYGATAYPTCLILRADGRIVKKLVGYHPPEDFLAFLQSGLASRKD